MPDDAFAADLDAARTRAEELKRDLDAAEEALNEARTELDAARASLAEAEEAEDGDAFVAAAKAIREAEAAVEEALSTAEDRREAYAEACEEVEAYERAKDQREAREAIDDRREAWLEAFAEASEAIERELDRLARLEAEHREAVREAKALGADVGRTLSDTLRGWKTWTAAARNAELPAPAFADTLHRLYREHVGEDAPDTGEWGAAPTPPTPEQREAGPDAGEYAI